MTTKLLIYVAGALLLALLGVSGKAWKLTVERDALVTTNDSLSADRKALSGDLVACKSANVAWRGVVGVSQTALLQCVGERHDIVGRSAAAAMASRNAEARIAAEYRNWHDRFRAAAKTPDCATALEMQLCAAVLDY